MFLKGCQEGKVGVTGTLASDETCDECGQTLEAGMNLDELERL